MNSEQKLEKIITGYDINFLIDKFKLVNVNYQSLFKNINQRKALEQLILNENIGYDKVSKAIEIVAQTNGLPYAPDIRTPVELLVKWSKWIDFLWKEKAKKQSKGKRIISST